MTEGPLIAVAFVTAALSLLFAQICLVDASRALRKLSAELEVALGHDTKIFQDYDQHP
jgi:hypothetical protein